MLAPAEPSLTREEAVPLFCRHGAEYDGWEASA
jgi:hypothetical protein